MRGRPFFSSLIAALLAALIVTTISLDAQDVSKWDSFKIDRSRGILRDAYQAV
jgi:hypothetical protein